jgi:hypothetical protein
MITFPNLLNVSHHLDSLVSHTCLVLARSWGLASGLDHIMLYFGSFNLMPMQDIHILVEEGALISDSYVYRHAFGEKMPHHF